jgi:hypothetical protein
MMTNLDYFDNWVSIILTYALFLWRVCRQFSMDGFGSWVWGGGDGYCCILFGVFFYIVPLVVG